MEVTVVVPVAVVAVDTSPAVAVAVGSEVAAAGVKADSIVVVATGPLVVKVDSTEAVVTVRKVVPIEAVIIVHHGAREDLVKAAVIVQLAVKVAAGLTAVAAVTVQLVAKVAAAIPNDAQGESQPVVRTAGIIEFIRPASQARPRQLSEPRPSVAQMRKRHRRSKSTLKFEPKRNS